MGRRKIEIVKVKDMNTRQITFSKRRTGLFKKASELSIMCGAKIAVVVFSPGNKPYSFAHPGVHDVAAEFLRQEFTSNELQRDPSYVAAEFLHQEEFTSNELQRDPSSDVAKIQQFSLQLADLMRELDEEEKKSAVLGEAIDQCQVNQLSELEKSHASLAEFNSKVKSDIEAAETMILFSHQGVEFPVARKKNK